MAETLRARIEAALRATDYTGFGCYWMPLSRKDMHEAANLLSFADSMEGKWDLLLSVCRRHAEEETTSGHLTPTSRWAEIAASLSTLTHLLRGDC
jgi:hypothetical protein